MSLALHAAQSPREACSRIAKREARLLAGGTLLVSEINNEQTATSVLVDLGPLNLRGIKITGTQATIGAMTTMADIAAHPKLKFLKPVAEAIGGPAVRNMATVGGNLHAETPYGDLGVALLALDAKVTLEMAKQRKTLSLEDFFAQRAKLAAYVLTAVSFTLPGANSFFFVKAIRRKPVSASVITIAAHLPVKGKKLAHPRIALGAMAPHPVRAKAAEKALDGKALDEATIAAAAAVATEDCAPQTDPYASAWYRREIAPVHLARLLQQAAGKKS
ncbi:MAG: FAD binding domain-containing protein [Hyphomicrobiales bacterium]